MTSGTVIAITGPAAAGKSTLARALQEELSRGGTLWLICAIDTFADSLRRDWSSFDGKGGSFAARGFVYARDARGGLTLKLGGDGRRVLCAFHRSVAAVAASGVDVVCETVVYDDADWDDWVEALQSLSSCWVKLSAPLPVLEEREKDRPQEVHGLARGMLAGPQAGEFDIEIDTSIEDTNAAVKRIVSLIG